MARCEVCGRWPAEPVCPDCLRDLGDAGHGIRARCVQCAMPIPIPKPTPMPAGMASVAHGVEPGPGPTPSRPPSGPSIAPTVAACGTVSPPSCTACRLRPPPLDTCVAALPYAYPWDHLITRLKFGGEPGLAVPLARLMAGTSAIARALDEAEAVIALPLSPTRLAARGYNQAFELARRLAPHERLLHGVLRRVRDTEAQSTLGREDREANLRHAFAVDPARAATMRGRRLLLVDDVMTSGATLHAAARVLRRAGAAHVGAVVLARTDLP